MLSHPPQPLHTAATSSTHLLLCTWTILVFGKFLLESSLHPPQSSLKPAFVPSVE